MVYMRKLRLVTGGVVGWPFIFARKSTKKFKLEACMTHPSGDGYGTETVVHGTLSRVVCAEAKRDWHRTRKMSKTPS